MKPIVIIGAGMAGFTVAREVRKLDKDIPLVIMTSDAGGFYSKPMLSNAFAQNKHAAQLVTQSAEQMAAQLNASIMASTHVQGVDTATKSIVTDGAPITYDKLCWPWAPSRSGLPSRATAPTRCNRSIMSATTPAFAIWSHCRSMARRHGSRSSAPA